MIKSPPKSPTCCYYHLGLGFQHTDLGLGERNILCVEVRNLVQFIWANAFQGFSQGYSQGVSWGYGFTWRLEWEGSASTPFHVAAWIPPSLLGWGPTSFDDCWAEATICSLSCGVLCRAAHSKETCSLRASERARMRVRAGESKTRVKVFL